MKIAYSVELKSKISNEKIQHYRYIHEHYKKESDIFQKFADMDDHYILRDSIVSKDGMLFSVFNVISDEEVFFKYMTEKINYLKKNNIKTDNVLSFNCGNTMKIMSIHTNFNNFENILNEYGNFFNVPELKSHDIEDMIEHIVNNYSGISPSSFNQLM